MFYLGTLKVDSEKIIWHFQTQMVELAAKILDWVEPGRFKATVKFLAQFILMAQ